MKWKSETPEARRAKEWTEWQEAFAYFPTQMNDGTWVWLELFEWIRCRSYASMKFSAGTPVFLRAKGSDDTPPPPAPPPPPPRTKPLAPQEGLIELLSKRGLEEKRMENLRKEVASRDARISILLNRIGQLTRAGDALSLAAQTTGGTAGRDEGLVQAIQEWSRARDRTHLSEPKFINRAQAGAPDELLTDDIPEGDAELFRSARMNRLEPTQKAPPLCGPFDPPNTPENGPGEALRRPSRRPSRALLARIKGDSDDRN